MFFLLFLDVQKIQRAYVKPNVTMLVPTEVTKKSRLAASSRDQNLETLTSGSTEAFWSASA